MGIQASITDARSRFDYAVNLLVDKIQVIAEGDGPPKVIIVALPNDIIETCWSVTGGGAPKPTSTGAERRILRAKNSRDLEDQLLLFSKSDYSDPELRDQLVYRNFRRALKARTMGFNVPIQLLRPGRATQPSSTVAWNFFIALYYKAGGFPWVLEGLDPTDCFVGVSFHRHIGEKHTGMFSSLSQVFTNRGDGIVMRGDRFEWDEKLGKSPHLNQEEACKLTRQVVHEYERIHGHAPSRVILHKTSGYWDDELKGFQKGLERVSDYDFLALSRHGIRLFREGLYPPLRGTHACIGKRLHVLYTMGYVPVLNGYPRGYVPDPLTVTEHHGQSGPVRICGELMGLTKMNWNSADFASTMPITLRFARQVGEIMSEIPLGQSPKPSFRFYM